ncbi:MAG: hypothetical protein JWQ97_2870 [Phenylobacterium sp.]|nr:hypothetical protein [Phenylobacterium sp.]
MAKYLFLIMVNPVEGQDDELNSWLDEHHIPEVLQTQGFKRAQRFEHAAEDAANPKKPNRYMHYYEIETDDLAAVQSALAAGHAGRTPLSPALDLGSMFTAFYKLRE